MSKLSKEDKENGVSEVIETNKGKFYIYDLNTFKQESVEKKQEIPLTEKENTP